ncbi:MAG: hypothetical protein M1330_05420 [Armatimonadetes bacterium]|nr:hypothetical protein [Armatimonadota bacterium]
MVAERSITVNSTRIVGKVEADPSELRAEGGPLDPRLIVPVKVSMQPQSDGHQVALVRLSGSLHVYGFDPASQVGPPVSVDLISENFPCRSIPNAMQSHEINLSFNLASNQIKKLEEAYHQSQNHQLKIDLRLKGTVAWLRHTGNMLQMIGNAGIVESTIGEGGWDANVGMFSDLSYFWNTTIETLGLMIEQSVWVDRVLPGLGLDRVRLIEMQLPRLDGEEDQVLERFNNALNNLDWGNYKDSIAACRDVRYLWEQKFDANKLKNPIADILAQQQNWPENDPRRQLLNKVWEGWAVLTSKAHHLPEENMPPFTAADARFCLLLTAILTEYLMAL